MATMRSFGAMLNQMSGAGKAGAMKPLDAQKPLERPMKPLSKKPGAALWSRMLNMDIERKR